MRFPWVSLLGSSGSGVYRLCDVETHVPTPSSQANTTPSVIPSERLFHYARCGVSLFGIDGRVAFRLCLGSRFLSKSGQKRFAKHNVCNSNMCMGVQVTQPTRHAPQPMNTTGLMRSRGLSFISLIASSICSKPSNRWVIINDGSTRPCTIMLARRSIRNRPPGIRPP
ncbi:hypothetical protein BAQU_1622 [Bifidobacterium aquikefiri]|uniref:Uncharacterized protein n=1 Tax=Bifidobacterium aquikefiri TaxID=1653207 RepID=A0A261G1X4_9BIFI|nr:hypothetical protein BAQU_1622 [Bifidobacterium aquikefiri]